MAKKIFVIAGEASGDLHGANLIQALKTSGGASLTLYGVGGDRIRQTGVLEFFDLAHFHANGVTDALRRLPQYFRAGRIILDSIKEVQPDLVVLIDNPGFNLHLAKKLYGLNIPVLYYIAPQLWAWGGKRILQMKRLIRKVLVVFEFEKKIYEDQGIPVAWVGHPLKDIIGEKSSAPRLSQRRQIALLPGSRKGEISMLLPVFLNAAVRIDADCPGYAFALIKSPTVPADFYDRWLDRSGLRVNLVEEKSYDAIGHSALAVVCSGTATTECALLGTPMIISNKASLLTYLIARGVIRVPFLGMPNLILGGESFPELLQYDATPEKIAREAVTILTDPGIQSKMENDLAEVSRKLGPPGASLRAASEILSLLG